MLTLPMTTKGNLFVLEDATDPRRLAVAAKQPAVALRSDGSPRLRLVRWATVGAAADNAGEGRLDLDLTVDPSAADLAAVSGFTVAAMPWHDAQLLLEGPGFEAVEAEVSVVSGTTASVSVDLPPHAAAVLEALLTRSAVSPLQVVWTGRVLVQLPAVEVIASCSSSEVRTRIDSVRGNHSKTVTRTLIQANAHIEIRGGTDPALEEALREWALDELLNRFAAGEDMLIRRSASDVVLWPIRLASTLDQILPEERGDLVQVHILETEEVGFPSPIDVRVLGDFSNGLERVDVELEPLGAGRPAQAGITDQEPRHLGLRSKSFRWRRRLKYVSGSPGEWSDWVLKEDSSSVLIPVPQIAPLRVEAVSAGLNFETRWSSVRVVLEHQGASQVLELSQGQRSAVWEIPLREPRGRVSVRLTFLSRNGQSFDQAIDAVEGDHVIVADPFAGERRNLALIPVGTGWAEVSGAMVDLRYRDGQQVTEETIPLAGGNDFAEWSAPARLDGPRAVEWRSHVSFVDGRFESSQWASVNEGVLTVPVVAPHRRSVQILPVFFDAQTMTQIDFAFRSGDFQQTEQLTDRTVRTILAPPGPYRWSVSWQFADGSQRSLPEQEDDFDALVLPKVPSP